MDFLDYSLTNRETFLNILSDAKELNMDFIAKLNVDPYLELIEEKYIWFINKIFDDYVKEFNLDNKIEEIISDFISSISPQIKDRSFITKDEILNHIFCIEYNMVTNIHKFSFDVFELNHKIDPKPYFYGEMLTDLLADNKITIKEFRETSPYDIDNFNHINLHNDLDYLIETKMLDIYFLTILSDAQEKREILEVIELIYPLNNKKILPKYIYRYLMTCEDAVNRKRPYQLYLSYVFYVLGGIFAMVILLFVYLK